MLTYIVIARFRTRFWLGKKKENIEIIQQAFELGAREDKCFNKFSN